MAADKPAAARQLEAGRQRLQAYLRRHKLRATRQRELILEVFLTEGRHISAEELFEQVRRRNPGIGHATVYRSLGLFADAGIAKVRRFDEGCVRYEPGIQADHHDHLVCTRCGAILEFEDPTIERLQAEAAARVGFRVQYHRLELYGLCRACQASA